MKLLLHNALLLAIQKGKSLKKVDNPDEARSKRRGVCCSDGGGGGGTAKG